MPHPHATEPHRETLAVAMSGGVDSTAVALALRDAGHEVVGLTALLTAHEGAQNAVQRAEEMCRRLGIPHHVADLREGFEREVIGAFVREYARGRTPNPCIRCNERVKFGLLLEHAHGLGAGRLATGHYARLLRHGDAACLLRAVDRRKDQSYVLHHLAPGQLARALFPLGERTRSEVEKAVAAGLGAAPLPPSQDICFLHGTPYHALLRERVPEAWTPGDMVDTAGTLVGRHDGLARYTVGQRKGLGIGGAGGRKFVLYLDTAHNRVILGEDADLWVSWCEVDAMNLLPCPEEAPLKPGESFECEVMVRYNGLLKPARVLPGGQTARVEFLQPTRAPTPGQSAVFYRGEVCLGGGVIERTELTERHAGR